MCYLYGLCFHCYWRKSNEWIISAYTFKQLKETWDPCTWITCATWFFDISRGDWFIKTAQVSLYLMKLSECRVGAEAEMAAWLCRWTQLYLEKIVTAHLLLGLREQWASGELRASLQFGVLLTVNIIHLYILVWPWQEYVNIIFLVILLTSQ